MYLTMLVLGSAFLTIFVEALVFITNHEYRNCRFLLASAIINFTTNVLLNICFILYDKDLELLSFPVLFAEAIVFIVEFIAYGLWFRFSWKLCGYVFLANAITYSLSFLFL